MRIIRIIMTTMLIGTAQADTIYVSPGGWNIEPYDTWWNAATTPETAVDYVRAQGRFGDIIELAQGEYVLSRELLLPAGTTLRAITNNTSIRNEPGTARRLITMAYDCTVDGLALGFGDARTDPMPYGGAILAYDRSRIINCQIQNCYAQYGGGISLDNFGEVSNNLIIFNQADNYGGGIYAGNNNRIVNTQISGNRASGGGGLFGGSENMVSRCLFGVNEAVYNGGGVSFNVGNNSLYNSFLVMNRVTDASGYGGGVKLASGDTMDACTVISNQAGSVSGGVYNPPDSLVINSIVYFNTATSDNNITTGGGVILYSCTTPLVLSIPPSNISSDPLLDGAGLTRNSPCINAGLNEPWMTGSTDGVNKRRIVRGRVDMGFIEFQFPSSIAPLTLLLNE